MLPWKTSWGTQEAVVASSQQQKRGGGGARTVMLCSATCLPSGIPSSSEAASPRSSFNSPSSGDVHGGVVAGRAVSQGTLCLGSSASL